MSGEACIELELAERCLYSLESEGQQLLLNVHMEWKTLPSIRTTCWETFVGIQTMGVSTGVAVILATC